jgi:Bacterial regulatory helix-turn-helix protein, lysR family
LVTSSSSRAPDLVEHRKHEDLRSWVVTVGAAEIWQDLGHGGRAGVPAAAALRRRRRGAHVSRAARRLFVAQRAVGRDIRRLEERLGLSLLDRDTRRVTFTRPASW